MLTPHLHAAALLDGVLVVGAQLHALPAAVGGRALQRALGTRLLVLAQGAEQVAVATTELRVLAPAKQTLLVAQSRRRGLLRDWEIFANLCLKG